VPHRFGAWLSRLGRLPDEGHSETAHGRLFDRYTSERAAHALAEALPYMPTVVGRGFVPDGVAHKQFEAGILDHFDFLLTGCRNCGRLLQG